MSVPKATKPALKRWSPDEIRRARQTPLRPVLLAMGTRLDALNDGNDRVIGPAAELIIKEHYWTCDDGRSGNAIDYLMRIEGLRFEQAVKRLLAMQDELDTP